MDITKDKDMLDRLVGYNLTQVAGDTVETYLGLGLA